MIGTMVVLGCTLFACGDEACPPVACVWSLTFNLRQPVSGLELRIGLEPRGELTCSRASADVPYDCTTIPGEMLRIDLDMAGTIRSVVWDWVAPGAYRFFIEADGQVVADRTVEYDPAPSEDRCGCYASAVYEVD